MTELFLAAVCGSRSSFAGSCLLLTSEVSILYCMPMALKCDYNSGNRLSISLLIFPITENNKIMIDLRLTSKSSSIC